MTRLLRIINLIDKEIVRLDNKSNKGKGAMEEFALGTRLRQSKNILKEFTNK